MIPNWMFVIDIFLCLNTAYFKNGVIESELIYKNGNLIKENYFDKDGKIFTAETGASNLTTS